MNRRIVIGLAAAALSVAAFLPAPAVAQELPPFEAVTIIRSMGMNPLGRPVRRGSAYVLRALDAYGQEVTVTLDAQQGRVLSVRPVVAAAAPYGPPPSAAYPSYGPPGYAPPAYPDEDVEIDSEYEPMPPGGPPPVIYSPRASYTPQPPARANTARVPTPKSAPVAKTATSGTAAASSEKTSPEMTTGSAPDPKDPAEASSALVIPPVQALE